MGNRSDLVSSDISVHLGNNTLRDVIRFDLVRKGKVPELRRTVPVSADDTFYHSLMAEVISARSVTVSLTRREEQCHILRMTGLKETLLKSLGKCFRARTADKTAGRDGYAIFNHICGFFRSNHVYSFH